MRFPKFLILFSLALVLSYCTEPNSSGNDADTDLQIEGKVTFLEIEGGFWAIQEADETYEPRNLSDEFKKEGLEVSVVAHLAENQGSYRMVGPVIEIISIKER